jgi:5'-nucleotidase
MALANAQVVFSREGRDGQGPLESVIINGSPLIEEQTYRLVSCEYLWLSPLFEEFQRGCHVDIQPCLVRDVLLEKMKEPRLRSRASQPRYLLPRS